MDDTTTGVRDRHHLVEELLGRSDGRYQRVERNRRITSWMLAATAGSIPIVAAVMWLLRNDYLDQVDCQTQGPYDCAYDANLAAGYGAIVGVLFLIVAAGAWALARRWPRAGAAIGSVVLVAWLAMAALLIAATRT